MLSIIAQGNARRPSSMSSATISGEDDHLLEGNGLEVTTGTILQRRRSSRLNSLRFLPDNILVLIFSYLTPLDLIHCTYVCQRWHLLISRHSNLWRRLFLRPDCSNGHIGAVHVRRLDIFLHALATRFSSSLIYIDLPIELITVEVLRELAIRCPNLEYLTLDFSSVPIICNVFNDDKNAYIRRIKPSRKMTSDKQIHKRLRLHGNSFNSLKSCNCIADEKSNVKYSKFGQRIANSRKTSTVINSIGKSI
ncbi:unnamed protein product [Rotaria sp. Silwood2]|nr:unnamed protein product [Rotaria sp. Silwood2]